MKFCKIQCDEDHPPAGFRCLLKLSWTGSNNIVIGKRLRGATAGYNIEGHSLAAKHEVLGWCELTDDT